MNKRLYRIVFNKARGMLMVVSELARGCAGTSPSSGIGRSLQRLVCRVGALSFALWLASGAVTIQAAGIVADASAPGKQQPTVISTANGTTQVNIQTPSAGGVSRNTYSQFDVGRDGVILNNSHKNTSTQIGGMVTANPWLAKGEAKVILNEVNAHNPSQLNGYIEVAGQKADVVIASPSGITCDGCGFINAGRATLTTGTAQMQDGRITGYQVERGDITVNGSGLDSTRQEHTDIIARAVQVNAAIHAQDLRVTTGRNAVDAAHEKVSALADKGAAKPALALDVAQVGGMYAGKIRLLGTEKGVGVRNAGNIGAEAGTVTLSADGRIENSGALWSSADATLSSTASVQNSGSIAAEHNVSLTGTEIASTGTLAAGVLSDGSIGNDGNLTLNASGTLNMHGLNAAGGNIKAVGQGLDASGSVTQGNAITLDAGQGSLSTENAQIVARDTLSAATSGTLDNNGGLLAADQLTLSAKRLQNQKGQISQSGTRALTLNHQDGIDNREGVIAANTTVNVNAASLDNRKGQVVAADTGTLTIKTTGLMDNREGEMAAADSLSVTADRLDNSGGFIGAEQGRVGLTSSKALMNAGGTIAARDTLTLDSAGLNNDEGLIQSGADTIVDTHGNSISNRDNQTTGGIVSFGTLHVNAGSINNQHGMLAGVKETEIWAKNVDNRDGTLASDSTLQLHAHAVDNQRGTLSTGNDLSLALADNLDNRNGTLSAAGSLSIHAGALDNTQGTLVSGKDARIDTSRITNQRGMIAARSDLAITGQRLNNDSSGLVQSGSDLTLAVEHINNRNSGDMGGIVSQGNLSIKTTDLQNDAGVILTEKQATLDATRFSNIAGTLFALDTLTLATHSDSDNRQGIIQGSGIVLDTHGYQLDNREGTLYSLAAMQLATAGLNNQNGTLGAKGDFSLLATSLDNRSGGRLVSEQAMALTLDRLDNQDGQIQSLGKLVVNAVSGAIDNTLGLIRSGATVTLNAASLLNRNTQAEEKGIEGLDVTIHSQQLENAQGTVLAGKTLSITNVGTLDNTQGELSAAGKLSLSGAAMRLLNTDGVVIGGERVNIDASDVTGDGQLLSLGDMALRTRQAFNNTGDIIANGSVTFTTPGRVTNAGNLLAGTTLDLTATSLFNAASGEIAAGATWLSVAGSLDNYGLIDGSQTWLRAGTLTNAGTGRIYGDHLSLQATTLNNLAQGGKAATLAGRQRVDIGADTINNRDHALIYSDGALAIGGQIDARGFATGQAKTLNNHSATIESAGDMALSIGLINNVNDRFSTDVALISTEEMQEYQHRGSPDRWDANTAGVFVNRNSADRLLNLNTPDDTGANNDNFYEYSYTRTIEEEVITESDPGKILSGGNMLIAAHQVLNDKSQIVAGGTLGIFADSVDNVMPEGSRWITDAGSVTHYSRKSKKGGDSQGKSTSDYTPPVVIQSITLNPGRMEGNSQAEGSDISLSPATAHGTDATLQEVGSLTVGVETTVPGQGAFSPELPAGHTPAKWIETPASDAQGVVIRAAGPDTRLPDSSLFNTLPDPSAAYLVETDPRFTNNKTWLGSDYMQNAFATDPNNVHKRLGDGYYEQRLVREQIIALTGGRYLGDYRDDETQFKALMDTGIAFGQEHQLIPGVALTAEQMSLLTEDMVWLVNTRVQLANGSWQTVMVPQVYVRVQPGDIDGSGALMGGQNVVMNLNRDLVNSGTIHGREVVQLSADNITNRAGTIQGADVSLLARTDINNIGGTISGNHSVLASAGRDINITTTTRSAQSTAGKNSFERTAIERVAGIYVQGDDGKLVLNAGRDLSLTGAQVVNSGSDSQTVLNAGRDLNLSTVTTSTSDNLTWDKDNWLKQSVTQQVGSQISGAGDVTMIAGRDVNAQAAYVEAGDQLGVGAGRDISITAATERSEFESHHKSTGSSGALSKKTVTTHDVVNRETAQGALFSGDTVILQADNNLLVQGSNIVGDNDVHLAAGNNLTLTTAEEHNQESHQRQEKKSGFSGTGGIGFSYGKQSLKVTDTAQDTTHRGSTIGSINGNVTLSAGSDLNVHGSELIAGQDMTLAGKNVSITAASDSGTQTHTVEQKTSGLTLALSGAAGGALDSSVRTLKQAGETDNDRLAALQAVKGALTLGQSAQAVVLDQATGDQKGNDNTIGVSLSYGSQSSTSTQTSTQTTAKGSSLTAGNNLTVVATDGDLLVHGSQLDASNDLWLQASQDVNLISALNTSTLNGKNESHGSSAGVGIGYGSGGLGINVSANVNGGKGKEHGNGTTHTETTVNAGETLSIVSGRDATLAGAQASGKTVVADIGRNLTLVSEQDTDSYDSKQQNASAGGSFTFGSMSGSASVNYSRDKMTSDYASVKEQTGIFAGTGGFDITVGDHTQLDGAVIASTAEADRNRLDTGTLGWRDIHNTAEYEVEHQSVGISTGGSIAGQFAGNMASNLLAGADSSGSAEGTTHAAVGEGTITVRDGANQTQDITTLSRDMENANGSIDAIFDKEKELRRMEEAQLIAEIGMQVADIARTQGEIAKQEAMKDPAALSAAEEKLRAEGKSNPTPQEIADQAGRTAMEQYGTGSDMQRAIQAATAAVQGLTGGDMTAALAGAAAPYVAEVIGHRMGLDDTLEKAAAHAVANAVLAAMQGKDALAGAAGALAGELAGTIALEMYGKDVAALSESEKQTISALETLAAGIAGGVAGDGTASAIAGAQSGKTVVENNLMAGSEDVQVAWLQQHGTDMASCADEPSSASCQKAMNERDAVGLALASGGVALLPGGAQVMWGLGAAANAGVNYWADDAIDPANAAIAGWVNVFSMGNGIVGTVGWNAAGGAFGNWIDNKDPLSGAISNGIGSAAGYGIGKGITWSTDKVTNAVGKWVTNGWDPKYDPTWIKYAEVNRNDIIRESMKPSNVPGTAGDIGGSIGSELGGKATEKVSEEIKK